MFATSEISEQHGSPSDPQTCPLADVGKQGACDGTRQEDIQAPELQMQWGAGRAAPGLCLPHCSRPREEDVQDGRSARLWLLQKAQTWLALVPGRGVQWGEKR